MTTVSLPIPGPVAPVDPVVPVNPVIPVGPVTPGSMVSIIFVSDK